MDSTGRATHVYINPIKSDRASDWESFTRTVIAPMVATHRPELSGRVRLLRADGDDSGATVFAFIFDGGDIGEFNLEPLFAAEYGEQEGRQRMQEWQDMFAGEQYGWTFYDVPLGD